MPVTVAIRATFKAASNIAADNTSNTFHFSWSGSGDPANLDNPLDMLEDLYCTVAPGSTLALGRYINGSMSRQVTLTAYNLNDPEPRVPIAERFITLPAITSGTELPAEVALVASFQATPLPGLNQRRRRGRVYLGPLQHPGTTARNPQAQMLLNVTAQFAELKAASDASVNWEWGVFSTVNQSFSAVTSGWVDNTWDTQRRRGPRPTARTTF